MGDLFLKDNNSPLPVSPGSLPKSLVLRLLTRFDLFLLLRFVRLDLLLNHRPKFLILGPCLLNHYREGIV